MKKNFFGVMAAMMVLTLSCKKDKEPLNHQKWLEIC